jgi:hypothetical protein
MSFEFHGLPLVVDERVRVAQFLDGNRPRKALGARSLLFAHEGERCGGYLGPTKTREAENAIIQ